MELTDQVTSVETSRKLQAAGVDCHSGLVHVRWKTRNPEWQVLARCTVNGKKMSATEIIPAWTAAELAITLADSLGKATIMMFTPGDTNPNPAEAVAALILEATHE